MGAKLSYGRGCLLGLAIGDAMGGPVETKTLEGICTDYGPNGLLGYDLTNSSAEVSSYTQIAAFVGNGMLLGVARGKTDYHSYIVTALREWARNQKHHRDPERSYCWVAKPRCLRLHNNQDSVMLDSFFLRELGTPEQPVSQNTAAGMLSAAIPLAIFAHAHKMRRSVLADLAVRTAALTHGRPEAFLSTAVLALWLEELLADPQEPLEDVFGNGLEMIKAQYAETYPQGVAKLTQRMEYALELAKKCSQPWEAMEKLQGFTALDCLAGAVYAALYSDYDFDTALVTAVNHSGASAGVGAVTGAIMGAVLGAESLPDFYLESLVPVQELETLAWDLMEGRMTTGLFNNDWDHKYIQGLPPEN